MGITEREFLLLVGIIAILITCLLAEWEMRVDDEEIIVEKPIRRERNFHSETFDELDKNKVYKW